MYDNVFLVIVFLVMPRIYIYVYIYELLLLLVLKILDYPIFHDPS